MRPDQRDVADRRRADRRREARQRRLAAEEPAHGDRPVERLGDARERHEKVVGDQVADAGVEQERRACPALHVVFLGPRRDRHRPERVSRHQRARAIGHARLEHRLEVLAETRDRVVAVASPARCPRAHAGRRRPPAGPPARGRGSRTSRSAVPRSNRAPGPRSRRPQARTPPRAESCRRPSERAAPGPWGCSRAPPSRDRARSGACARPGGRRRRPARRRFRSLPTASDHGRFR